MLDVEKGGIKIVRIMSQCLVERYSVFIERFETPEGL